ncbi:MAG: GTP cyclohydrolase FolE2 [Burkholderiaceae bacterium]|jgi:GTP cyclohydrolase I|nr:GTP cyclohydrolase FolE2 [Burkholderiaceae bacterium]
MMNLCDTRAIAEDIDAGLPGGGASCGASGVSVNPGNPAIPDVQNKPDTRRIAIQQVGVKGVRHPFSIRLADAIRPTVGTWNMYVHLPDEKKGTHMSRFIALLEEAGGMDVPLDMASLTELARKMLKLLDAAEGRIEVTFPCFIKKRAPVTQVESFMDYEVSLMCGIRDNVVEFRQKVLVPVTSLCPCSREISAYGAHNQRSHITVDALLNAAFPVEELIARIEEQGSCELYGLLKRPDEKFVTERAYDNPKFVEDLVRDVAGMLNADERVAAYTLEAENFESIHNHSAYARIEFDKRA